MQGDDPEVIDMFEEGAWLEAAAGVPDLKPWSSRQEFIDRLRQLNATVGGNRSKEELYARWQKAEKERSLELQIEKSLEGRRKAGLAASPAEDTAPRTLPVPVAPSALEQERHMLTHYPPAPWCLSCVRGKARQDPHLTISWQTRSLKPPIIMIDFM